MRLCRVGLRLVSVALTLITCFTGQHFSYSLLFYIQLLFICLFPATNKFGSTHIDKGGSVTDILWALFYPPARNASPPGKIEPPKNLSQNAPLSMCVSVKKSFDICNRIIFVLNKSRLNVLWGEEEKEC